MMGQLPPGQNALFYQFCIDNHVPSDHLLRAIDAVLDLERLRSHLTPYYSMIGGPSIDPELMIRMLLVGYGIRSERRLCEEVHLTILPTGGSAAWGWRERYRTTQPSRRTATGAFATVAVCVGSSGRCCAGA